jgi:ribosomal protein S18 acetylase RimI-like enzyme
MNLEEFRTLIEQTDMWYAASQVRVGNWEEDESLNLARTETAELLPNGFDTPNHFFRVIQDERSGERVGDLWFYTRQRGRRVQLFVCWIGIEARYRRRGYATEVFSQLEIEARRLGAYSIALATAGDNEAALSLYTKLGFRPRDVFLARPVSR